MSDQFIPGVGNEVIAFIACVLVAAFTLLVLVCRSSRSRPQTSVQSVDNGQAENVEVPAVFNRDTCPICLGEHILPAETNCGHLFCGICIRQYYEISNVTVMTCPLCRSNVNMLFIMFTNAEKEDASLEETRQIIYTFVDEYNQRCLLIRRTLVQVILDWPTTMRHLWNELFSINGLMYVTRAPISLCVIAAVVYILSPLDIIPEAVFGLLGLLDDLFVIFLIGLYVSVVYRRLVIMRGAAGNHL
ncbi:Putative ring finger protein [Gryllus bimaculatus]|nr:Putative ring finger protein [Gryllus bimaculatus]